MACGYERLTSITEKTGDDSLFANPTVFGYDEDSISLGLTPNNANIDFVAYSANNLDPKLAYGCVGDFNGDGRKDVLNSTISNSNLNIITMEDKISLDNNDNDFIVTNITSQILPVYERISKTLAVSILEGDITSGFKKMQKDAWCDISKLNNGTGDNKKHIYYIKSRESYSNPNKLEYVKEFVYPNNTYYHYESYNGDFNGDGLSDIIEIPLFDGEIPPGVNILTPSAYLIDLDKRLSSYIHKKQLYL